MSVIPIREMNVSCTLPNVVGVSAQMAEVEERVRRIARTTAPVLLRGDSGTGKRLLARAIHMLGARQNTIFKSVNCAALTHETDVAELFGIAERNYSGRSKSTNGHIRLADKGTLFLGHVGTLSMAAQSRLLQLLDEQCVTPVGASTPSWVDVRLITSTTRPLDELVAEGTFSEDLMYRLRVIPIEVPSLSQRQGDIDALLWHFIGELNGPLRTIETIDSDVMCTLNDYHWRGNIRELRNVVEYAMAMGDGPVLSCSDLPSNVTNGVVFSTSSSQVLTLDDMDRRRIVSAMEQAGGRRGQAAEILGISRSTLWRRLRHHQLMS